jgi:hypothetical protein
LDLSHEKESHRQKEKGRKGQAEGKKDHKAEN